MEIWDVLVQQGWAAVERICVDGVEEGQTLEFKRKERPENAEATRDDRKSLGESLSALSNAVGGVLIFGIEDKKGESDIDRADKPQPLNDAVSFASKIKSIVPEILSPPHGGIKVMAILQAEGSNSGVIAIQVPEAKFRPHVSMAPGHQRYFQRAGASNRVMVDFQVRDMIRVQRSPEARRARAARFDRVGHRQNS